MAKDKKTGDCPYCSAIVAKTKTEKLIGYGQVVKCCPQCNQYFLDRRVSELAVNGIKKDDRRLVRSINLLFLVGGIIMFFLGFTYGIGATDRHYVNVKAEAGAVAGVVLGPVLFVGGLIYTIKDIISYKLRVSLLEEELKASKNRLLDPEYSKLLKNPNLKENSIFNK